MGYDSDDRRLRLAKVPEAIYLVTTIVLAIGLASALLWWHTGDPHFIRVFFSYPGALFFIGCNCAQLWFSLQCWRNFSQGDLLRPAWLLIAFSAFSQLIGAILTQILASGSNLNPLLLSPSPLNRALIRDAGQYGLLFSPVYMLFLALGLFYVLKACWQNGMLRRFRAVDFLLLGVVAAYTIGFFDTVVFAPHRGSPFSSPHRILSWTSDPLLCILLFEAILIRRSAANMGWGLVARCWAYFTIAIFATSVGDIGLWAWSRGYLSEPLQVASWYVWFLASAAYALAPCYQLQAMLHATSLRGKSRTFEMIEPVRPAV